VLGEVSREELTAALEQTAEELLTRAGWVAPPIDAIAVAEALGITVAFDAAQRERGRLVLLHAVHRTAAARDGKVCAQRLRDGSGVFAGQRPGFQPLVVLRPDPRPERQQWAAAHELAEYAAWSVFDRLGADLRLVSPAWRERVANLLAARLLLPANWLRPLAQQTAWDLLQIKASFATASHELILRRMLDFDVALVISVFDQGRLTLRRSNLPASVPPPGADELSCVRRVRRSMRPARCGAVAAWPAYEPGWRRELLRWEIDEHF